MTVAYLIMVHHQPRHLARLIGALRADRARFYVHVDARVDATGFTEPLRGADDVDFLDGVRRVPVYWGGFSQVRATLNLLSEATRTGADRYVLLTGSDYPIKPASRRREAFSTPVEFARIDRPIDPGAGGSHAKNVTRYHLLDSPRLNPYIQRTERAERFAELVDRIVALVPRRPPSAIKLYHGAANWALTDACVRFIMRFIDENPAYVRGFRHTLCPDEIFFHSILESSPFSARISHHFERTPLESSPERGAHYVDLSPASEARGHVLDLTDLPALEASGALFARKFDDVKSAELLNRIDELIREE